jgi:hypothetical protein
MAKHLFLDTAEDAEARRARRVTTRFALTRRGKSSLEHVPLLWGAAYQSLEIAGHVWVMRTTSSRSLFVRSTSMGGRHHGMVIAPRTGVTRGRHQRRAGAQR